MIRKSLAFAARVVETIRAIGSQGRVLSAVAMVECRKCGALIVNPTPGNSCVMCGSEIPADSRVHELQPGSAVYATGRVVVRGPGARLIVNRPDPKAAQA